jgi:hypothetical protein
MATRKSPASTDKKTTTGKAPARKAAASAIKPIAAGSAAAKPTPTYHEIAQLAEQFWIERGRPFGSAEVDWLRAESSLHA